jgi:hypothetical protein
VGCLAGDMEMEWEVSTRSRSVQPEPATLPLVPSLSDIVVVVGISCCDGVLRRWEDVQAESI